MHGENLTCIREPGNVRMVRDPYVVAGTKPESSTIVGHIPRKISAICLLFLRKGGSNWLANATNSAFSVQHALWFLSTTPILLISYAGGTAHARAKLV